MKKMITPLIGILAILLCILLGQFTRQFMDYKLQKSKISNVNQTVNSLIVENDTREPPPGYRIEYNVQTQKYRWCFPKSTICSLRVFNSKEEAIDLAWGQFEYEIKNAESNWKEIK